MSRKAVLDAMGVTVWVPREAPLGAAAEQAAPVAAPTAADAPIAATAPTAPAAAPPSALPRPISPVAPTGAAPAGDVASLGWLELRRRVAACQRCGLHATRTQTVFGVGDETADWMFVGEAPGADEDAKGEPFVGRAGQLLTSMIQALGLARGEVYIANILKCRPPGNRDPQPDEVAACRGYLDRQIDLIQPRVIVALGRIAAQALLGNDSPIGQMRGQWYQVRGIPAMVTYQGIRTLPIFHPAYVLRNMGVLPQFEADLKLACTDAGLV